ncbi:hypothetical protein H5410_028754 [Solanum commersonii]|uniref:RNase III domain-containing protein n=1 Tax=Solanum commersonii TaxID=4109 RepID=A0A9J5Z8H2_SOLCO|nr:hypothetical protein H5410_028754 [Solanum commersonii]
MNRYDVEAIMKSSLPIGGAAKRLKISLESEQKQSLNDTYQQTLHNSVNNSSSNNSINFGAISAIPCGLPFDANQPYYHHSFFPHLQYSSNDGGASDHTSEKKVHENFASLNISSSQNLHFTEENIRNQLTHDDNDDHKRERKLVEELEKITKYRFKNPDLLHQAFTHSSFQENCESYERLELLGN